MTNSLLRIQCIHKRPIDFKPLLLTNDGRFPQMFFNKGEVWVCHFTYWFNFLISFSLLLQVIGHLQNLLNVQIFLLFSLYMVLTNILLYDHLNFKGSPFYMIFFYIEIGILLTWKILYLFKSLSMLFSFFSLICLIYL